MNKMSKTSRHQYNTRQQKRTEDIKKLSFDRFGDDLSELILNYLDFEDKFRFECLNRRIKNLIHNKIYELKLNYDIMECFVKKNVNKVVIKKGSKEVIDYENFDYKLFETFVRKLKDVNSLFIHNNYYCPQIPGKFLKINFEVMKIVADNCNRIKQFKTYSCIKGVITLESIEYFAKKCGKNLININMNLENELEKKLLEYTPNVCSIKIYDHMYHASWNQINVMNKRKKLFPKLTQIGFIYSDSQEVIDLEKHYSNQINDLSVRLWFSDSPDNISSALASISNLKRLTCLKLFISDIRYKRFEFMFNSLKDFFQSLPHLHKLDIEFGLTNVEAKTLPVEYRKFLKLIGDNCKQLRELAIGKPYCVRDESDLDLKDESESDSEDYEGESDEYSYEDSDEEDEENDLGDKDNPIDDLKGLNNLEKLTLRTDVYDPSLMNIELILPKLKLIRFESSRLGDYPFHPYVSKKYLDYLSQSKQFGTYYDL